MRFFTSSKALAAAAAGIGVIKPAFMSRGTSVGVVFEGKGVQSGHKGVVVDFDVLFTKGRARSVSACGASNAAGKVLFGACVTIGIASSFHQDWTIGVDLPGGGGKAQK